ncbi:MAG: hypothetical protein AAGK37_19280 [Pseudomonadota bacterium]
MKDAIFYYVREYSESEEFPAVTLFRTQLEARDAMVSEVFAVAAKMDKAWVTEELDLEPVERSQLSDQVFALNVQRPNGAVDCFRLMSQTLKAA